MASDPRFPNENLPEIVAPGFLSSDHEHLSAIAEQAKDFARQSAAEHTQTAYAADWRHFSAWCRRRGVETLPPSPEVVGLYISDCASPTGEGRQLAVSTIERRLSGLTWNYRQRGLALDRSDRHIASVIAGIRRTLGRPPVQKEAILTDELLRMVGTLGYDLRGMRDRALLLLGFAGALRRSELVGLNVRAEDLPEGGQGWIDQHDLGLVITLRGKTGWRQIPVGLGSEERSCPVKAVRTWMEYARIERGPIFRPILKDNKTVDVERLSDRHVANLVKRTASKAGLRGELSELERRLGFSGHSLRAGLATSVELDERYVQKHLGHASAEMTRRYQRRRDLFRTNLTKAAGL